MINTAFRTSFKLPSKSLLQWFPGHMDKGLKQIRQKLKSVDCIIEVHDARIPLTGRNPNFKQTIYGVRPHLLVLNKIDLCDLSYKDIVRKKLNEQGVAEIIFSNCKDQTCLGVKSIVPSLQNLISKSNRFNRSEEKSYCIMIIGVPNVGKSSLINNLRNTILKKSSAASVGALAGVTRSVQSQIKISEYPKIYLLDTPGILTPKVPDEETGMKLALCSSMQDHIVGTEIIADYLLFWLNKQNNFSYVNYLGLQQPTDDIHEVLIVAAVHMKKFVKYKTFSEGWVNRPDTRLAAEYFIKAFRNGSFGKIMLDKELL